MLLLTLKDDTFHCVPTVKEVSRGICFRRLKKPSDKWVYMMLEICGDLRIEFKDPKREFVIVNVLTGRLFSIHADEPVEILGHAAFVEDYRKVPGGMLP